MKQCTKGSFVILKVKLKEDEFDLLKSDLPWQQDARVYTVDSKSHNVAVYASFTVSYYCRMIEIISP